MLSKWNIEYCIFFIFRKDKCMKYPLLKYKAENVPQHMSNLIAQCNPTCTVLDWVVPHFLKLFWDTGLKILSLALCGALYLLSWPQTFVAAWCRIWQNFPCGKKTLVSLHSTSSGRAGNAAVCYYSSPTARMLMGLQHCMPPILPLCSLSAPPPAGCP